MSEDTGTRPGFWQRRRDKMVAEIERNRTGGHRVPTWVMALAVVAMLAAWALVIALA
jgi:fatty acid desaturase